MGCCSVHCPHGHTDCELVTLVQREIETASDPTIGNEVQRALAREANQKLRDEYGRKVPVCSKCGDSGWVPDPRYGCKSDKMVPCSCPCGEQV